MKKHEKGTSAKHESVCSQIKGQWLSPGGFTNPRPGKVHELFIAAGEAGPKALKWLLLVPLSVGRKKERKREHKSTKCNLASWPWP